MLPQTKNKNRLVLWSALVVAVLLGSVLLGKCTGSYAGRVTVERAQTIWPNIMQMPEADRAIIARAAILCHLTEEHATAQAVVACLREGAAKADERDPATNSVAGLERLLTQATQWK